jgi:hypothetical protein
MNEKLEPIVPDDLDDLLHDWGAAREASSDRLSALHRQIAERLAEQPVLDIVPAPAEESHRSLAAGRGNRARHSGPAWFLAGAASVLLVVAGNYWLGRTGPEVADKTPSQVSPKGLASLSKEDLLAKARLYNEMRVMFDGQLEWLAETSDHLEVGLAQLPSSDGSEEPSDKQPLVIQMVVERRAKGGSSWQVVWATEVIAPSEERVALRPVNGAVPAALSLWAYRLPDGMVFVESNLKLSGAQVVEAATSGILENNRATEVATVDAGAAEYRVLQTAAALDEDRG